MLTTNKMFYIIKKDLSSLEDLLYETVESPVELITDIGRHLISSGGKRIRPALYILATKSSDNVDKNYSMPLAMAIEMIHTASLVHDDVLDNAATRRGSATANAKWGNNIAVLTGDYLFAKAFSAIAKNDYGPRISELLASIVCDLSEGEILQNHFGYSIPEDFDVYYDRIAKKTANFIAVSCELGAIVAKQPEENIKALREYGYCIGMAFQIVDDILDLTSSSKKIGKPAGNDILQGVITLPVIYAYKHSSNAEELKNIIENRQMTHEDLTRAIDIVKQSDGIEFAKTKVNEFLNRAHAIIPNDIPESVHKSFDAIADFIGKRDY